MTINTPERPPDSDRQVRQLQRLVAKRLARVPAVQVERGLVAPLTLMGLITLFMLWAVIDPM